MIAPGSAAAQVALLASYERYVRAEQLCEWFPGIKELGIEADRRHEPMFKAALLCGFDPAWSHAHLSCLTWTERRVRVIETALSNHVREYRRTA